MDDLLLLGRDPNELKIMIEPIDHWLQTHRHQRLNPDKTHLTELSDGICYLGYELYQVDSPAQPLQVFSEPLKKWKFIGAVRKLENAPLPQPARYHPLSPQLDNPKTTTELTSINSRLGTLTHCRSYLFKKSVLEKFIENTNVFKGIPKELADPYSPFKIKKGYRAILLK
jgi:hypothetical protein